MTMFKDTPTSRSPIRGTPLRLPGQSLDEELHRLEDQELGSFVAVLLVLVALVAWEWIRWAFNLKPHPFAMTFGAVVCIVGFFGKFRSVIRRIKNVELGREGERAVGQALEALRAEGAVVIHDVPGDGFNVDHVVICQGGVFAVETKAMRKRGRDPQLTYAGEKLFVPGASDHSACLSQARREAAWICRLLTELSGSQVSVKPVVAVPGWFVNGEQSGGQDRPWVLPETALVKFISGRRHEISEARVSELSHHLRRHVINSDTNRVEAATSSP